MDNVEKEFFDDIFLFEIGRKKCGCALLGKTDFVKLDKTIDFLSNIGWVEYSDYNEPDMKNFIIINCLDKNIFLPDIIKKNKNMPCIILDNCESILQDIELIKFFAYVLDEDYINDFEAKSVYVFLGNKNTIPKIKNKYIESFLRYISVYDSDMGKLYVG